MRIQADRVTLVGAGPVTPTDIRRTYGMAPYLVAADGGAQAAIAAGVTPNDVVGDLDSMDAEAEDLGLARIHHVPDQDRTDFMKCLDRIDAGVILAIGFTGGRLDHELAVWNALVRFRPGGCVVLGSEDVVFHLPQQMDLDLPPESRLSLFPMAPVRGRSVGLHWPIEGIAFRPDGPIGTSNRVTGGRVTLEMDGAGMLAIMPREALPAVLDALPDARGR